MHIFLKTYLTCHQKESSPVGEVVEGGLVGPPDPDPPVVATGVSVAGADDVGVDAAGVFVVGVS